MKRPYQIEDQRAVQLLFPSIEIVAAMKRGGGELIRQAGLQLVQLVREREGTELAGEHYRHGEEKQKFRWGKE